MVFVPVFCVAAKDVEAINRAAMTASVVRFMISYSPLEVPVATRRLSRGFRGNDFNFLAHFHSQALTVEKKFALASACRSHPPFPIPEPVRVPKGLCTSGAMWRDYDGQVKGST